MSNQVISPDHQCAGVSSGRRGYFKHPIRRLLVYRDVGPLHEFIQAHVVLMPDMHIQRVEFIGLLVVEKRRQGIGVD